VNVSLWLPCQSASVDHGDSYRDSRCTLYHLPLTCTIEGFWSLLHRPVSLPPVVSSLCEPSLLLSGGGRVYVCKPCFVKLEKCCKTIPAVQQIVNNLCELCPCCLFLWWWQLCFLTLKAFTTCTAVSSTTTSSTSCSSCSTACE